jgi:S1-C subfamily serine protease
MVDPRSAAGRAGLLGTRRGLSGIIAGDVIIKVDGTRIRNAGDIDVALSNRQVGDTVSVAFRRGLNGVRHVPAEAVL